MKKLFLFICVFILLYNSEAQTLHTINSGNFYYTPSELIINIGDTVQCVNESGYHNLNTTPSILTKVFFNNLENFISSLTSEEILLTRVFKIIGTYEYDCSVGTNTIKGRVGSIIVNSVPSSKEEKKINLFSVYNTSSSKNIQIQLKLNKTPTKTTINIYNLAGQHLRSETIKAIIGNNLKTIDFSSNIPFGVYFVALDLDGEITTKKIAIRKNNKLY